MASHFGTYNAATKCFAHFGKSIENYASILAAKLFLTHIISAVSVKKEWLPYQRNLSLSKTKKKEKKTGIKGLECFPGLRHVREGLVISVSGITSQQFWLIVNLFDINEDNVQISSLLSNADSGIKIFSWLRLILREFYIFVLIFNSYVEFSHDDDNDDNDNDDDDY